MNKQNIINNEEKVEKNDEKNIIKKIGLNKKLKQFTKKNF